MVSLKERIEKIIYQVKEQCLAYVVQGTDGIYEFLDPIDKVPIRTHYSATHFSTGLLLSSLRGNDTSKLGIAIDILDGILARWNIDSVLPDFHFDFNNFALCIFYDTLSQYEEYENYLDRIKEAVLDSKDSDHETINWLPMRIVVNRYRYEWTKKDKYRKKCMKLYKIIKSAEYDDGFFDDRLPKGISFNLQYDIATVALLQFMRCKGADINLGKNISTLFYAEASDGDINYIGRGTNQIFAWGMWIYLLSSSAQFGELDNALHYLEMYLPQMLINENLMLNEFPGQEKVLWWDYHHFSVYIAHFYMWLELALRDFGKCTIQVEPTEHHDSGITVYKTDKFFLTKFSGRSQYLCERGPVVSALGTRKHGMIFKGTFGPLGREFGKKYSIPDLVYRNYLGVIRISEKELPYIIDYILKRSRLINKMPKSMLQQKIVPTFANISINKDHDSLHITFRHSYSFTAFFNLPVFSSSNMNAESISLKADGKPIQLIETMKLKNQYQWCVIYQSRPIKASEWTLSLKI